MHGGSSPVAGDCALSMRTSEHGSHVAGRKGAPCAMEAWTGPLTPERGRGGLRSSGPVTREQRIPHFRMNKRVNHYFALTFSRLVGLSFGGSLFSFPHEIHLRQSTSHLSLNTSERGGVLSRMVLCPCSCLRSCTICMQGTRALSYPPIPGLLI